MGTPHHGLSGTCNGGRQSSTLPFTGPVASRSGGIRSALSESRASQQMALGCEMKVFLDDERATPEGWTRVYWPSEAIALLQTGAVQELSLDHDLGDDARGTGYDVILWIEEQVALRGFSPPQIVVHSANSAARDRMLAGIRAIEGLVRSRD